MSLYDHQKKIIDEDPVKTGLFLGTGSGKTRIALMLARGNTLIVAPKTQTEDGNWLREAEEINKSGHFNNDVFTLSTISKETFRRDHEKLPRYDTLIFDEAHTIAGVTPNVRYRKRIAYPKASQLFEAAQAYIERTAPQRLYLATATPIRSPMTVWGLATLLGYKWDFYKFRDTFYIRLPMPGREVWQVRTDSATKDRLAELVRKIGYTGRLEDYFDVPEQTYRTMHIELNAEQKRRIKEMALEFPDPLVRVGKIHQIENGILAPDEFNKAEIFNSAKIDKILELALEFPNMVIFAKYTTQIRQISEALRKEKYKVYEMTGETKDRGNLLETANKFGGYFICQAQISAGWELPTFPVMVFVSRTYSFVDYDQGIGRIQRAHNIKKNLYINLVVRGGVDEAVDRCISQKKDFSERIYLGV